MIRTFSPENRPTMSHKCPGHKNRGCTLIELFLNHVPTMSSLEIVTNDLVESANGGLAYMESVVRAKCSQLSVFKALLKEYACMIANRDVRYSCRTRVCVMCMGERERLIGEPTWALLCSFSRTGWDRVWSRIDAFCGPRSRVLPWNGVVLPLASSYIEMWIRWSRKSME